MRDTALAALLAATLTGTAAASPLFEDLTAELPAPHHYTGGWEHYVGGGVAVLDCDGSGTPDLYVAGGDSPATLLRNITAAPGARIAFAPVDALETALTGVTGAYPLDIDGDGHLDLFVMRVGENAVLRGLGDCRFERTETAWNIAPGTGWTTAFSATWEPGNAWPTLAVGNYVDRDDPDGPFRACADHQLLRPADASYAPPETITPGHCTLSMLFTDWGNTGRQDLWISNDRHYYVFDGREQLVRITPQLRHFGEADGWPEHKLWGMGIASRDITGDGRPEIAVTSMADQKLFTLPEPGPEPAFASIAYARGTTAHVPHIGDEGRPSTGWHIAFGDVDNDGLDDLYIAKGNVSQMPDLAIHDPDNLLMQGPDGRFTEAAADAGVASMERGRGGALVDLNRDGQLDLVVVQREAPLALYQNVTPHAGNWLKLRLSQPSGNVRAVGAKIELVADGVRQLREVQVGGGHAGGHAGFEHFGLGSARRARVRVIWPDARVTDWVDAAANTHLVAERSASGLIVRQDRPAQPSHDDN